MTTTQGPAAASSPEGLTVSCPVCRGPVRWEEPPRGPFCSERCRLVDLGAWAEGRYAIPGSPPPDEGQIPAEPGDTPVDPTD
jgi:endogenous inhibitor of DNA gyrase (YacG/DUF329 family)